MKRWKAVLLRFFFIWPVVIYLILVCMITLLKESLVYPGVSMYRHLTVDAPLFTEAVEQAGVQLWRTGEGQYLGLKSRSTAEATEQPDARWLIFYGNGDVGLRATGWFGVLQQASAHRNMEYYVMDYPGYGPQSGETSEVNIVELAQQALAAIPDDGVPLYLFGQSMGAGVSCRLVREPEWNRRVSGLLLTNPYTSLVDASHQYLSRLVGPLHHLFPVEWMLGERYDSAENITAFEGRVVIIAGEADTLTPAWMAEQLSQQVVGPVELWIQPGVGHWTVPEPARKWRELMDFVMAE